MGRPEQRQGAAAELARLLGGEGLLFFAPDPELGVPLPAPGLPQVLQGARKWHELLQRRDSDGAIQGEVPGPDGRPVAASVCALGDGTAAVLIGGGPHTVGAEPLRPILPLLGALFQAERQVAANEVRARSAVEAVERANQLTTALQEMRRRLEDALAETLTAREETRRRAEQAESLAEELQRQAEQLQDQAAELEMLNEELEARTEEAERARAAADEASRAKSEFLANMSHELRTPINAVIGYAELLNLGITGPVTPAQQAQLERIRASSAHLLGLVNDILDLAKVEAGQMTIVHEREPIAEVVTEALALIEGQAVERQLTLTNVSAAPGMLYLGDRHRVRQILVNLLSNAVKFTEPGGRVEVAAGLGDQPPGSAVVTGDGPWAYISVEDSGIGMAADELRRVFQPFVQAESGHTRVHGGTGLGLTISRQLARLMGGDLTARSEPGRGSRFTLWLPAVSPGIESSDPDPRFGAPSAVEPGPAGLSEAGSILREALPRILKRVVRRVREEVAETLTSSMGEGEILDHAPVFVADLGCVLARVDWRGGDPSLLRAGPEVQRLIAEGHGADRARRGWPPEALRQELEILRQEIIAAIRDGSRTSAAFDLDGVVRMIEALLEATRRACLRSHAAALVGAGYEGFEEEPSA